MGIYRPEREDYNVIQCGLRTPTGGYEVAWIPQKFARLGERISIKEQPYQVESVGTEVRPVRHAKRILNQCMRDAGAGRYRSGMVNDNDDEYWGF